MPSITMTLAARSIRSLLVALILSLMFVAVTAPSQARAASLTTAQINAVIGLLQAFDVPQATITQVSNILKGTNTAPTTPTTPEAASATIDHNSLTSSTLTPTLRGTAKNTSVVGISISNSGGKVYGSGLISVKNGRWSVKVSPALPHQTSSYAVQVYDGNNNLLATGNLSITLNSCNSNSNANRNECDDEDEEENEEEDAQTSDDPAAQYADAQYVGPTIVVTYPNSKGPYDITRDSHYGTRILVSWRTYNLPAGSRTCTYLRNMNTSVDYPLPEDSNCISASTGSNKQGSNQGYARVPAGNNYRAKVVAYSSSGAFITQALNGTAFSMENLNRPSQEKKAARDSISTDSAGKITFGGSATVSKIYITILQSTGVGGVMATLYDSPAITVSNGRWSHTTTRTFTQGTYSVAILDEAGNVLDSGFVYVNPSMPKDTTGGTSVTEATLTATPSAGSLWVSFRGSTGRGCDGKTYTLDYGNGVTSAIPIQAGTCQPIFTRSYPYSTAGTYTVKLLPPATCSASGVCTQGDPLVTTTVTVPGPTSAIPQDSLVASLAYLPESLYETMAGVTDFLAAVEMAPIYIIADAFSDFLFETGLY